MFHLHGSESCLRTVCVLSKPYFDGVLPKNTKDLKKYDLKFLRSHQPNQLFLKEMDDVIVQSAEKERNLADCFF